MDKETSVRRKELTLKSDTKIGGGSLSKQEQTSLLEKCEFAS